MGWSYHASSMGFAVLGRTIRPARALWMFRTATGDQLVTGAAGFLAGPSLRNPARHRLRSNACFPGGSNAAAGNTGAMPSGRTRFRLMAAVGATLLSLLVAEAVLRLAAPVSSPREGFPAIVEAATENGGPLYRLAPAAEFTHSWDGDPYGTLPEGGALTYRIDAAGYRSGDAAGAPTRLLVLGDSFTFGEGVEVGDRFTEKLGPGVFNAGVPGWSSLDEVAVLPELLAARRPRAVLIVAQPNDAVPIPHAQRHAGGDLLALGGGGEWSRLVAVVRASATNRATEDWYRSYWTGERREFGAESVAALQRAGEICRAQRVRLGVVVFPMLHRLADYPFRDVHAVLRAGCDRAGIAFLDLAPAFEGRSADELWVHPSDHHPNAAAHTIAAEALRPFVNDLLR